MGLLPGNFGLLFKCKIYRHCKKCRYLLLLTIICFQVLHISTFSRKMPAFPRGRFRRTVFNVNLLEVLPDGYDPACTRWRKEEAFLSCRGD